MDFVHAIPSIPRLLIIDSRAEDNKERAGPAVAHPRRRKQQVLRNMQAMTLNYHESGDRNDHHSSTRLTIRRAYKLWTVECGEAK